MAKIADTLVELNPWWKRIFAIEYHPREIYEQIQKFLPLPQILALTGLRRTGKTTLMFRIVEEQIRGGFDPLNIIYFSFDEFREVEIRDVMKEYEANVEKDFREGRYILLLDEIQKLSGWENQLKGVYDAHGKNIKIFISGSESLFIRRKTKETLAGRIFEFRVDPLSFKEFLGFREMSYHPLKIYEKELLALFFDFIGTLGLPELVFIKDEDVIRKYIKESIVEKVVFRDIAKLYKIRDISLVESLLNIFMEDPGQLVEVSSLAAELKVSRQTLANYLKYLEDSFLIHKLYNFSRSRRKVERKLKKYYPAVVSPRLLFSKEDSSRSKVLEWLVVTQKKADFFWRDPYKNEVDVIQTEGKLTPIEIKYGKIELKGLLSFMKRFNADEGYIVSWDQEGTRKINGKTIFILPTYKFLLK